MSRSTSRYAAVAFLFLVAASGCKKNQETPPKPADHQFKLIADKNETMLKTMLAEKGSQLSSFKATVTDETDVQKKVDYPHIGTISFSYAVTKPEGEIQFRSMSDLSVHYHFSSSSGKWQFVGFTSKLENAFLKGMARIVQAEDVQEIFKD